MHTGTRSCKGIWDRRGCLRQDGSGTPTRWRAVARAPHPTEHRDRGRATVRCCLRGGLSVRTLENLRGSYENQADGVYTFSGHVRVCVRSLPSCRWIQSSVFKPYIQDIRRTDLPSRAQDRARTPRRGLRALTCGDLALSLSSLRKGQLGTTRVRARGHYHGPEPPEGAERPRHRRGPTAGVRSGA